MEYFKDNHVVIFGMPRSGTNALCEKLAHGPYKNSHLYIKEPFSIKEYNISYKKNKFNFFPKTIYQSTIQRNKILIKIAQKNKFIMNICSNSIQSSTYKLLHDLKCKFLLIERKNYIERFLSHFLAIQNNNHHGPSIHHDKETFTVGLRVLNNHKQIYLEYLKFLEKMKFEEKYIYEDCTFSTTTYKSNYNLPKEEYFKNMPLIRKFLNEMVKTSTK